MTTISEFMEKDHDRLDAIFSEFRKIHKVSSFAEFKTGLQRHIVWEEKVLFPFFEEKAGAGGPTAVMRLEHISIRECLEKIHDSLSVGTASAENSLLDALTPHNQKEESVLYPSIDSLASDAERKELFRKMESIPQDDYNKCCE